MVAAGSTEKWLKPAPTNSIDAMASVALPPLVTVRTRLDVVRTSTVPKSSCSGNVAKPGNPRVTTAWASEESLVQSASHSARTRK